MIAQLKSVVLVYTAVDRHITMHIPAQVYCHA